MKLQQIAKGSAWMVRAGRDAHGIAAFREQGVVAVGWGQRRALTEFSSREAIDAELAALNPDLSPKQRISATSQLDRFRVGMAIGDRVVTYDPESREYLVGVITGEVEFAPGLVPELPNLRRVRWDGTVSRDLLSASSRNSPGAIQPLFRLPDDCIAEIESALREHSSSSTPPAVLADVDTAKEPVEDDLLADLAARSHEFIKDRLSALTWDDMERLVAGLLRAMGYKTRLTNRGPDRGADILASPDGFGFEQPRIVAEVKHRRGQMGAQDLRSFLGGRHKDDKGLYVSTGGFTRDARYEAERASIPLTLMDLDALVEAVVNHYELMDGDCKALLRLRRLYWPA